MINFGGIFGGLAGAVGAGGHWREGAAAAAAVAQGQSPLGAASRLRA